jgi:HSP20 family protein
LAPEEAHGTRFRFDISGRAARFDVESKLPDGQSFGDWTMSDFYFGGDLFGEFDRLQRQMSTLFGSSLPSSIRSSRTDAFPQLNIGATDDSIEIVAFAPGVDPASLDLTIDKNTLTISGERKPVGAANPGEARTYAKERYVGAFRRVVELPQTADADKVQARYTDGVLFITVGKREASKPRAITIQ